MNKLERQIQRHNGAMQQLTKLYSYPYARFLDRFSGYASGAGGIRDRISGNLLITGGAKDRRRQTLLRQIEWYRERSHESIIIFSTDPEMKAQLIGEANAGRIGQLFVVDREYRNYDFFYRMPLNLISGFFAKAALLQGYRDTAKLLTYTNTLLDIIAREESPSLAAIREWLQLDDARIASAAASLAESEKIMASLDGGASLRDLVTTASRAFLHVTTSEGKSKLNLLTAVDQDCVILIDLPADDHELFAVYYSTELRAIMDKSFKVIFDDEVMINNQELFGVVKKLKQRSSDVVLSYENIISVQPEKEDILDNMAWQLVFLNGSMPAVNLQQILSRFGQFNSMMSMENQNAPPVYLFTFRRGKSQEPVTHARDRAMLQELGGMEAVLAGGSSSEIIATKHLII